MAKINKWGEIVSSQSNALKGEGQRSKNNENIPANEYPDWLTSAVTKSAISKDKESVEQKDNKNKNISTTLDTKQAQKSITPTEYNDEDYEEETEFSSPSQDQESIEPTNIGGYEDYEDTSVSYDDPVISTKPTPTSEKLGLARPGPSSFIQTAKYNPSTRQLNIAYTDGKVFPYHNVSPEMADKILKERPDHSPGQTVNKTIFKGHGTTKADEIDSIEEGM